MENDNSKSRMDRAMEIVQRYKLWAAGLSLVPVPLLDAAAIAAAQLKMIQEISEVYGAKLSDNLGKSILASLLGGVGTIGAASSVGYLVRSIPVVGPIINLATMPALAATTTYAVGVVLVNAFETKDASALDPNAVNELIGAAA